MNEKLYSDGERKAGGEPWLVGWLGHTIIMKCGGWLAHSQASAGKWLLILDFVVQTGLNMSILSGVCRVRHPAAWWDHKVVPWRPLWCKTLLIRTWTETLSYAFLSKVGPVLKIFYVPPNNLFGKWRVEGSLHALFSMTEPLHEGDLSTITYNKSK